MSEQIQYQNIFDFELIPKTGITDVISGDRLPMEFTRHHTFRFTRDFVDDLKKVCSCRSISLALAWLIDDGMNCLERERKVLYIAPNGVTSVRHMDSFYIADARCREQFSDAKYYRFMMPVGVINRLNALCTGRSKSVAAEALENHPEFEFWREQGVSAEMFERNIQEHDLDPEALIISAKHYAFEYSQPGKTPPEKSYLVHFLGGLKRFKMWDRPVGYVSHEARQIEALRLIIEANKKEAEELEKLQEEAAFSEWYQKYLKDPESEAVQAVMKQATEFDLKQIRIKEDKQKWLKTLWVRVTGC